VGFVDLVVGIIQVVDLDIKCVDSRNRMMAADAKVSLAILFEKGILVDFPVE